MYQQHPQRYFVSASGCSCTTASYRIQPCLSLPRAGDTTSNKWQPLALPHSWATPHALWWGEQRPWGRQALCPGQGGWQDTPTISTTHAARGESSQEGGNHAQPGCRERLRAGSDIPVSVEYTAAMLLCSATMGLCSSVRVESWWPVSTAAACSLMQQQVCSAAHAYVWRCCVKRDCRRGISSSIHCPTPTEST